MERVRDWYLTDRPPIRLPKHTPTVSPPPLADMAGGIPTNEQYSAVCNVLTTPFSYVWGAPGTGKTRFVLANCVLAYLRRGKKVLLTAPTNNALEQMLFGILDVLHSCGIPNSCVCRLGIPSAAFAAQYPESCERLSAENRRDSIIGELNFLTHQLHDAERFAALQAAQSIVSDFYAQLRKISFRFQMTAMPEQELASARVAASQAQEVLDNLENTVQALTIWIDSVPGHFSRLFRPALYSEKAALLNASTRQLEDAKQAHISAAQQLSRMEAMAKRASQCYYEQLEELRNQFTSAFPAPPIAELSIPVWISLEDFPSRLRLAYDAIQSAAAKASVPEELDDDEIKSKIRILEAELAEMDTKHRSKWAEVKVLAMTIDRFISSNGAFTDFEPQHIFMDEAAYCSLIKGYTFLSLGCPVTLLGDHAQLPPVCEMSERTIKRSFCPEFLWSQSAIYLDSVFQLSEYDLYSEYQNAAPPSFYDLGLNRLSITHRFGPGLSQVLSDFIYGGSLSSARADETDIKYIHAPSSPTSIGRTSQAECAAICSLAEELTDKGIDFAVLTPYKKQVALLSKSMPTHSAAGKIMTIHAAQGKEFHTVILSIVDTANKFFTDSRLPIGCAVLDTAVSRVKSDLILVLDSDYWRTQDRQLIGQILRIATPAREESNI